jgi:hypothetical protein
LRIGATATAVLGSRQGHCGSHFPGSPDRWVPRLGDNGWSGISDAYIVMSCFSAYLSEIVKFSIECKVFRIRCSQSFHKIRDICRPFSTSCKSWSKFLIYTTAATISRLVPREKNSRLDVTKSPFHAPIAAMTQSGESRLSS